MKKNTISKIDNKRRKMQKNSRNDSIKNSISKIDNKRRKSVKNTRNDSKEDLIAKIVNKRRKVLKKTVEMIQKPIQFRKLTTNEEKM